MLLHTPPHTLRCAAAQVSYAEDGSAESDFEDAEAERRARVAKRAAAVPALLTDAVEEADEVERVIAHRRAPRGLTLTLPCLACTRCCNTLGVWRWEHAQRKACVQET